MSSNNANLLPQPGTPKILYKYRAINKFCINMLSQGEIYFATVSELDDKDECSFRFTTGNYHVNDNNEFVYADAQERTDYILNHTKRYKNRGILSLCESSQEIKMWELYANNFNGICIGFDWEQFGLLFDGSYPPVKNFPKKVIYHELFKQPHRYNSPDDWINIFTQKSRKFAHEKEWRMFYKAGSYSHPNVRMAIREIIFGCDVSKECEKLIRELVADLVWVNFSHMKKNKTDNQAFIKIC
jgi:hypothetical protein